MSRKKISWTVKELKNFKAMILDKKSKTIKDLKENKKRADEMLSSNSSNALYSSHMADASSDHVEMEKAYYMIAREKKYLQYLDKAIKMINDGTFGICISCKSKIQKERLKEVPHTRKCFDCKTSNL